MRFVQIYLIFTLVVSFSIASAQSPAVFNTDSVWGYKIPGNKTIVNGLLAAKPFVNGVGICQNTKGYGAFNNNLEIIIPFKYSSLEFITRSVLRAKFKGKYILLKTNGKKFVTGDFSDAGRWNKQSKDIIYCTTNGRYGVFDSSGNSIFKPLYSSPPIEIVEGMYSAHKAVGKKHLTGIINRKGEQIIPFQYLFVSTYRTNLFKCIGDDATVSFYDHSGKHLYTGEDGQIRSIDNDFIVVDRNGKQFLTHLESKQVFEGINWAKREGCYTGRDSTHTIIVKDNGQVIKREGEYYIQNENYDMIKVVYKKDNQNYYGLWDKNYNTVLEPIYFGIIEFNTKWAAVNVEKNERNPSLVNIETKQVFFKNQYYRIEFLPCGMIEVTNELETRLLDSNLRDIQGQQTLGDTFFTISNKEYEKLRRDYNYKGGKGELKNTLVANNCGERHVINLQKQGLTLILDRYGKNPIENRIIIQYYDEIAKMRKVSLLNFNGKLVLSDKYVAISSHDNGYVPVGILHTLDYGSMTLWGLMDESGKEVIAPAFEKVDRCIDGVVTVMRHGLWSMINIETNEVLISELSGIRPNEEGIFHIGKRGLNGVCDKYGKIIVPILYKNISYKPTEEGLFTAERDGKKVYVDLNGKEFPRT